MSGADPHHDESTRPRIVVVGPGAIGCLFAASLARAGLDVLLLDKDPARAALIAGRGVTVEATPVAWHAAVPATASHAGIAPADILCVCVKAYDTAEAVRHALPLIGPRTVVVSLQNGLDNATVIASSVRAERVLCAVTAHGATRLEPGRVRHAGSGTTLVGAWRPGDEPHALAARFAGILTKAGLAAEATRHTAGLLWSKLAINAAINPVTALWDVPNGALLERPELMELAVQAAGEAERVARAAGITLLFRDAAAEVRGVCRDTAENLSSMLQDVRRGRRTEIDAINGAVVREARTLGVPAPVNEMLVRRVTSSEHGR